MRFDDTSYKPSTNQAPPYIKIGGRDSEKK